MVSDSAAGARQVALYRMRRCRTASKSATEPATEALSDSALPGIGMRAATFAKEIGRTVSFSLAAFRQQFAAGRDLSEPDNVYLAAAASELHPRALETAMSRDAIKARLREATDRAGDRGVFGVPAVLVGDEVFWGDDQLEDAARAAA